MDLILIIGFIMILAGTIQKARTDILNSLNYQRQAIINSINLTLSKLPFDLLDGDYPRRSDVVTTLGKLETLRGAWEILMKENWDNQHRNTEIANCINDISKRLENMEREVKLAQLYSERVDARLYHVINDEN